MYNESDDLAKTLMFTLSVIITNEGDNRQRIAEAYKDATALAATIPLADGSARPRIEACLARFNRFQNANDIAAAGWMLVALQERVMERDLPHWKVLGEAVDKAVGMLPPVRLLH